MTWMLAPLLGAGYCLAFAPFNLWGVLWFAGGGLLLLLEKHPTRAPLVLWLFGLGKYGVGASWVYVSIHVYGHAHPLLATVLVILFVVFVATLFCWPVGWLWRKLHLPDRPISNALLFVMCWSLVDWLLTWVLTGFPWLLPAHAIVATPFDGWLPVLGTLATGMVLLLSSIGLALLVRGFLEHFSVTQLAVAGALLALPWGGALLLNSVTWTQSNGTHEVALVQGNLDQATKWQRDKGWSNFDIHAKLSEPHWDVDLLVWPEAAITLFGMQAELALERLHQRGSTWATSVVVGVPTVRRQGEAVIFQNTAVGVGTARGQFAKHHLVPFGEYVPLENLLRGLIEFFDLPMSRTSPGPMEQPLIQTQLGPVAMAICYEVAYGESMRIYAQSASLLMTLSNDTWFGASIGPAQHMQIAQVRARENGRWLLRATNNGITAIVDEQGRILAQLPQFQAGVLRGEAAVHTGQTPYNRFGDLPFLCLIGGAFAMWLWYRRGILARSKN